MSELYVPDESTYPMGWAKYQSGFPYLHPNGYLVGGLLPGEIPYHEPKGELDFRCHLCKERFSIFGGQDFASKFWVCHRCIIQSMTRICQETK